MSQSLNPSVMSSVRDNNDDISLSKLNALVCILMTKFHYHQCPKLAQFIVRQLHLLLEQPEVKNNANSKTLYLQLLQQWQKITMTMIEQSRQKTVTKITIH